MIGDTDKYPQFKDLPLRKEDPPYSSWGLWGSMTKLGQWYAFCLSFHSPIISWHSLVMAELKALLTGVIQNHLTPEVVRKAAEEIVQGRRFNLKYAWICLDPEGISILDACILVGQWIHPRPLGFNGRVLINASMMTYTV
jgi:hypothetical protein